MFAIYSRQRHSLLFELSLARSSFLLRFDQRLQQITVVVSKCSIYFDYGLLISGIREAVNTDVTKGEEI